MSIANDSGQGSASVEAVPGQAGPISPRQPLYAVLLSLLMSGLGHIYCGRLVAGLAWAVVGAASGAISLHALATQSSSTAAWLPMWTVSILSALHAWWIARSSPDDYRLQPMNNWLVYVLFLVFGSFGAIGHAVLIRRNVVQAFVTPVSDMNPTFQKGDRFLIDKTAYRDSPVAIGDVIVFTSPETTKRTFVKRVWALAGDEVEIRDGILRVNGEPRQVKTPAESATTSTDSASSDSAPADFGPFVVPDYNCFVLGDNLPISRDSRHFGPVPYSTVKGKATFIFWPQSSWSRFGKMQ